MLKDSKILVLGSSGMVGSSIVRRLKAKGYNNILAPLRSELDLKEQSQVRSYFGDHKPDCVFVAAAQVGGIKANDTYRADFLLNNLSITNNVFESAHRCDVEKLFYLGSSCIYPKESPQPIKEEYLLTGPIEPTNEPYAVAKIAGIKLAENFRRQYGRNYIGVMPCSLYGENDNFHPENSHVIPGMIQRMDKTIKNNESTFEVWGTGKPRREFLYIDDLADGLISLMEFEGDIPYWINIGAGDDIPIGELAQTIAKVMDFKGEIKFNTDYKDGTFRKLLDSSKIKETGWSPKIDLVSGIKKTVDFFYSDAEKRKV